LKNENKKGKNIMKSTKIKNLKIGDYVLIEYKLHGEEIGKIIAKREGLALKLFDGSVFDTTDTNIRFIKKIKL
jgi:hypothetical protein